MPPLDRTPLTPLFSVPVLMHRWDDSGALNDELRVAVLEQEKRSAGQAKTNVGGWQSSEDFQKWTGEAGQQLLQRLGEAVNWATFQVFQQAARREEPKWRVAIWANVNRRGDYNMLHVHPGSTWSGVYYVDAGDAAETPPQNGRLTFVSPNLASTNGFFPNTVANSFSVTPQPGLMLVFPSYLQHLVHPYRGERPRISIAFNVKKEPFP